MRGLRVAALAAAEASAIAMFNAALLLQANFAWRSPLLHVALEAAASIIALLAGVLTTDRLLRQGHFNDLILVSALAVFTLINIFLLTMPALAKSSVNGMTAQKPMNLERLPDVLADVCFGEAAMQLTLVAHVLDRFRAREPRWRHMVGSDPVGRRLTSRVWDVLELLTQGRSTTEISQRLVISAGTVRVHIASIMHKLEGAAPNHRRSLADYRRRTDWTQRFGTETLLTKSNSYGGAM